VSAAQQVGRATEWPAALVAVIAAVLSLGGAWRAPWRLAAGGGWTEAPGHLAGLWMTAEGLWRHGPLQRVDPGVGWPDGFSGHLIDPASLLIFLPGWWLGGAGATGAVIGWNLLHLGSMVAGLWGMHALARRVMPDSDGAGAAGRAVAVAALGLAPYWLAHPCLGRTEYLVLLLLPAQLATLMAWVQDGRRRGGIAAALLLGFIGSNTGYNGVFALLLVLPLALWLLAASAARARTLIRLLWVAVGSLLVAAPSALTLARDAVIAQRLAEHTTPPPAREPLCLLVHACAPPDLSRLLELPLVLGLPVAALSVVAALLRPRRATPWLLLTLWLFAWGLGPWVALPGAQRLVLPAGLASRALPALGAVKEWSRIGAVLPVTSGLLAGLGAAALARRLPPRAAPAVALVASALIALDGLSFPRAILAERPAFDPSPPPGQAAVLAALPDGPLVTLPVELKAAEGQPLEPGFHVLHHLAHGRPVSATLDAGVDVLAHDSGLVHLALQTGTAAATGQRPPRGEPDCVTQDARALYAAGYRGVLVDLDKPGGDAIANTLDALLGAGVREGRTAGWPLPEGTSQDRPCRSGRAGRRPAR